jgi:hypothetical protein
LPKGCIFADKGPAAFIDTDDNNALLLICAIMNSKPFIFLIGLQLARTELAQSYEVGLIQQTPVPNLTECSHSAITTKAHKIWSLKRKLDTANELSHSFYLPVILQRRMTGFEPESIINEISQIQSEIDDSVFRLYGLFSADRETIEILSRDASTALRDQNNNAADNDEAEDEDEEEIQIDANDALLSWSIGVAFGRFDIRLATGEREIPPEPEPFDPLPERSPGMLPEGAEPFHAHAGILVDDPGHPHDLVRLVESVLDRVGMPVPPDLRRWLRKEFFPWHLQRYSKSRRKAPIYWPLATASGSYTLWVYYPALTRETLYTAVNEFIEKKHEQVIRSAQALRDKPSRSRAEEKELERLQDLGLELEELRRTLLRIAGTYVPNHDDGVQITAAPLWPLFRHKPWQKLLKETWTKLEKGDYDWSHLAMTYRPSQVREKCRTDKSLAIAHDLEALYIEPAATPAPRRRPKPDEADE